MNAPIRFVEWDQRKISRAGLYSMMSLESYHNPFVCDDVSISSSGLRKIFHHSPAHYWCTSPLNRDRYEEPLPRHFVIGRAMHHLALGEPFFSKVFAGAPDLMPDSKGIPKDWSLRLNSAKIWMEARNREGRITIFPDEIADIEGMSHSLLSHPMVIKLGLLRGYVERSAFWKDRETGIWLKIRPDVIPTDSGDFVDFKTTTSVQWIDLQRTIAQHGYAMQFALMREGFRTLGIPFASSTLCFIEKKPPYCVRVVTLDEKALDRGEKANRSALRTFRRCIDSGFWPGPGGERSDAEVMHLPEWAETQIDKRLQVFGE